MAAENKTPETTQTNGKAEKTPAELFEASVAVVGKKAKEIAQQVRSYKQGESELRELIMQVELGQIQFNRLVGKMAAAYKAATPAKPE